MLQDPERFAERVDDAARTIFGSTGEAGLAVRAATRRLREDCGRLRERGFGETPAIAVVGLTAQGKSWLTRCFLEDHPDNQSVRDEIRAGQNNEDRTNRLTWLIPPETHVSDEQSGDETFITAHHMLDLGASYQVIDTPGVYDATAPGSLIHRAVTSAPIKLTVVSVKQLRDGGYLDFIRSIDGSLIVPVVLFEPEAADQIEPAGELLNTIRNELIRWGEAAPAAEILADKPVYMPQAAVFGQERAEHIVRDRLRKTLKPILASPLRLEMAISRQIRERLVRARSEIRLGIDPFHRRVSWAVESLEKKQREFPERILDELLGEEGLFRAGLRSRFRMDWIERTPLVCFPYRSLLGLLALTHGAWDRLVFSFLGSIPSLGLTLFQTLKNKRDGIHLAQSTWESRLKSRVEDLLKEHFYTEVNNFRTALSASLPEEEAPVSSRIPDASIRLRGLGALETASRRILNGSIKRFRAGRASVLLFASLGFGSFWYLITGPLVSLYRSYIDAHGKAFGPDRSLFSDFPALEPSIAFASILLSLVPVFLVALIAIIWSCSRKRVSRSLNEIKENHRTEIAARAADETFAVEINDPELEAARFLLSL